MIHFLKNNRILFRQIGICCMLVFALFSFFAVSCMVPLEVEAYRADRTVNNSSLASFPGGAADDGAAVRWDYQCRSNMAVRLDKNNNFRSNAPVPDNGCSAANIPCSIVPAADSFLWHNQPIKRYYRRLWQKILPSRAGPCA